MPVKGVVSLSGPGDIKRFLELIPRFADVLNQVHGGGSPENIAKNMKEGSPVELLPLGVPQIFITGDKDPAVPIQEAREYSVKANAAGDKVEVIPVPGLHFENSVDPGNAIAGPEILDAMLKLAGGKAMSRPASPRATRGADARTRLRPAASECVRPSNFGKSGGRLGRSLATRLQITSTMIAPTTAPIRPAPSPALYQPIAWPI